MLKNVVGPHLTRPPHAPFRARRGRRSIFPRRCTIAFSIVLCTDTAANADVFRYVDRDGQPHDVEIASAAAPEPPREPTVTSRDTGTSPYPYDNIVREAASTYALPVELILAVMTVESGFNPRAVSRSGALGLMQLMPTTADNLYVADPFDPRQNTLGGARQLRALINTYGGDVPFALAAYNAGTAAVEQYSGIPPFPETQRYVETVLRLYHLYLERGPGVATFLATSSSTNGSHVTPERSSERTDARTADSGADSTRKPAKAGLKPRPRKARRDP